MKTKFLVMLICIAGWGVSPNLTALTRSRL